MIIGYPLGAGSIVEAVFSNLQVRPYRSVGSWISPDHDLGWSPTTQGNVSWQQDLPVGTSIEVRTSTSKDGLSWSAWSQPYADADGSPITSPNAQYIRVAATLRADETREYSPVLDSITIKYPDADPAVPVVSSSSHPGGLWASPSALALQWSMPLGNPAPESSYMCYLRVGGVLTATASGEAGFPLGGLHGFSVPLPQEGSYSAQLVVKGDVYSGGLTRSAALYNFGYDATPPGQTDITSPTHPPLLFTNNRNPTFHLAASDAMSGVSGYATVLDKAPTGDPGAVVNAGGELRYSALDNGTWYLHARAIDMAGNTGPVSHYGFRIDYNGDLLSPDYVKALPNPVRGSSAKLEYELAAPATEVTLEYLNSQGELLKSQDGGRAVGKNYVTWDLGGLANGVYLFRVKARSAEDGKVYSAVRKVAVLR